MISRELSKVLDEFIESYKKNKTDELRFDVLKQEMKNKFLNNKTDSTYNTLDNNDIVVKEILVKEYKPKEEIYDFLEDRGLLPLAVNFKSSLEKEFNLDHAKRNFKKSVRIYSGRNDVYGKSVLTNNFTNHYKSIGLEEISSEFNKEFSNVRLTNSDFEMVKQKLIEAMEKENTHSIKMDGVGTIKMTESYDYDPFSLYDHLTGKKELYLKDSKNFYDVVILPDQKQATLPKNFVLGDKELQDYINEVNLDESNFIKKRKFNELIKEGYKGFAFNIPMDPTTFFRSLPISRTKMSKLVDSGLITEEEMDNLFIPKEKTNENGEPVYMYQFVTKGTAENQRDMFFEKLAKRVANQEDKERTKVENHSLIDVEFNDFSFN